MAEEQAAGVKPSRSSGHNDGPSSSSADNNAMSLRLPGEHGLIAGDNWNALYGYVEKRLGTTDKLLLSYILLYYILLPFITYANHLPAYLYVCLYTVYPTPLSTTASLLPTPCLCHPRTRCSSGACTTGDNMTYV